MAAWNEYPNAEPKTAGEYVRTVHPCNVGRYPDGVVLFAEAGADEAGDEGTVLVAIGRGSTVYGPARNWRPLESAPAWLEPARVRILGVVDSRGYLHCAECVDVTDYDEGYVWSDQAAHVDEHCERCARPLNKV